MEKFQKTFSTEYILWNCRCFSMTFFMFVLLRNSAFFFVLFSCFRGENIRRQRKIQTISINFFPLVYSFLVFHFEYDTTGNLNVFVGIISISCHWICYFRHFPPSKNIIVQMNFLSIIFFSFRFFFSLSSIRSK